MRVLEDELFVWNCWRLRSLKVTFKGNAFMDSKTIKERKKINGCSYLFQPSPPLHLLNDRMIHSFPLWCNEDMSALRMRTLLACVCVYMHSVSSGRGDSSCRACAKPWPFNRPYPPSSVSQRLVFPLLTWFSFIFSFICSQLQLESVQNVSGE